MGVANALSGWGTTGVEGREDVNDEDVVEEEDDDDDDDELIEALTGMVEEVLVLVVVGVVVLVDEVEFDAEMSFFICSFSSGDNPMVMFAVSAKEFISIGSHIISCVEESIYLILSSISCTFSSSSSSSSSPA